MYSSVFNQRPKTTISNLLKTRILIRLMGGGPRTFPGGINKWEWKRLHEKRAKEKEKRLLDQEKQLYQARIRSQIRSNLSGKPVSGSNPDENNSSYSPMSPQKHVKALADRFITEGAEDLWNENDGPLKPSLVNQNQRPGLNDWRDRVDGNGFKKLNSIFTQRRSYSTYRSNEFVGKNNKFVSKDGKFSRNERFSGGKDSNFASGLVKKSENDVGLRNVSDYMRSGGGFVGRKQRRFRQNESSSSEDDEDYVEIGSEVVGGMRLRRKEAREIASRAALGRYDVKITKRIPLQQLYKETDFASEVVQLRRELDKSELVDIEDHKRNDETILSEKRFDESGMSPLTIKALTASGYIQMTKVQEATLSVCLEGNDAVVKAKTGTGKSLAYLLPAIEAALKATSSNTRPRVSPIYVLILSPTRELASQIAAEANALLKYHDGIGVQTLVGGTRFKMDQRRLESDPCQIVVATPGRLLDHIENKGGISLHLMSLKMLILDEADHLLDLGYRKDVEKIVDCLPRQRQSLMFSATIPKEVRRISQLVLKSDHAFIDTVGLGCVETPIKIKQSCLILPHDIHFQVVYYLLKKHILETPDYKVIVFCSTGMVTSLLYQLLREMKMNVRELHSRKPQIYRTRVSDEFKESKRQILITSDVSARGMNYPDVTLVLQVGIPSDREQYIHRLGRTGREGKDGEGIFLIAPWEEYFLDELKDLPLEKVQLPHIDPETKLKVEDSMSKVDSNAKEAAYYAWLGYYNSIREIGRDKTTLAELANQFSASIGLQKPPSFFRKTALKMGLKDIPGIRIRY